MEMDSRYDFNQEAVKFQKIAENNVWTPRPVPFYTFLPAVLGVLGFIASVAYFLYLKRKLKVCE